MPAPDLLKQLEQYAQAFDHSGIPGVYGFKVRFPSTERVEILIDPVRPEHRGGLGTAAINGGVMSAMFDLAIGCTPALIDPSRRSATVHLSINFEQPVHGDAIRAEAWVESAGASTVFSSAVIYDGQGKICARCQGIAKLSKLPWANGQSPGA